MMSLDRFRALVFPWLGSKERAYTHNEAELFWTLPALRGLSTYLRIHRQFIPIFLLVFKIHEQAETGNDPFGPSYSIYSLLARFCGDLQRLVKHAARDQRYSAESMLHDDAVLALQDHFSQFRIGSGTLEFLQVLATFAIGTGKSLLQHGRLPVLSSAMAVDASGEISIEGALVEQFASIVRDQSPSGDV